MIQVIFKKWSINDLKWLKYVARVTVYNERRETKKNTNSSAFLSSWLYAFLLISNVNEYQSEYDAAFASRS